MDAAGCGAGMDAEVWSQTVMIWCNTVCFSGSAAKEQFHFTF